MIRPAAKQIISFFS